MHSNSFSQAGARDFLNISHNKREKARNATLIVEMKGQSTYLKNPEEPGEEPKKFTFDYSYWSHDGFEEKPNGYLGPANPNYADQVLQITIILLEL